MSFFCGFASTCMAPAVELLLFSLLQLSYGRRKVAHVYPMWYLLKHSDKLIIFSVMRLMFAAAINLMKRLYGKCFISPYLSWSCCRTASKPWVITQTLQCPFSVTNAFVCRLFTRQMYRTPSLCDFCHIKVFDQLHVRQTWKNAGYGCSGLTLKWPGTYLVERSLQVHFANQQSSSGPWTTVVRYL